MTNRRDWFDQHMQFSEQIKIRVGTGELLYAFRRGYIQVGTFANGKWLPGILYDVLFTSEMTNNLFYVKVAAKKGVDFILSNNGKYDVFS